MQKIITCLTGISDYCEQRSVLVINQPSFETNNVRGKLESESPTEASFYQKPQQYGGN